MKAQTQLSERRSFSLSAMPPSAALSAETEISVGRPR
jgi:hypothetical protein